MHLIVSNTARHHVERVMSNLEYRIQQDPDFNTHYVVRTHSGYNQADRLIRARGLERHVSLEHCFNLKRLHQPQHVIPDCDLLVVEAGNPIQHLREAHQCLRLIDTLQQQLQMLAIMAFITPLPRQHVARFCERSTLNLTYRYYDMAEHYLAECRQAVSD